ncbi:MAG: hypothetical protein PHP92_03530 [Candidatus Nanoarchaeia archaeon]|nr:hypothetical protein [Candidatus Nanoarchaeia archaeon]
MKKIFDKINLPFDEEYLTPTWKELKWRLEEAFSFDGINNFLDYPLVQRIMTARNAPYIKQEKEYLKSFLPLPEILDDTTIHHLYHIEKYKENINIDLLYCNIIEWGGGYGDLCKTIRTLYNSSSTYILIDIPIMTYLQFYFLSNKMGYKKLNIINDDNLNIKKGKINLIALPFLDKMRLECDLFISTWAITESGKKSIDFVLNNNCFNAEHLLLGYETTRTDQFPYQKELIDKLKEGSKIINIDIISPYQFYLFR